MVFGLINLYYRGVDMSKLCYRVSPADLINSNCTKAEENVLVGIFEDIIKSLAETPASNATFAMNHFATEECDSIKGFTLEIERRTIYGKHHEWTQWWGVFRNQKQHKELMAIGTLEK